jgi:hypothetical protein
VRALDVHRQAGRLTATDYEDRSVRVARATTWADLGALFADLPAPRPGPSDVVTAAGPTASGQQPAVGGLGSPAPPGQPPVPQSAGGVLPERWASTVMAAAPILAVILFFVTGSWLWFLAIPLVGVLFYGDRKRGR